MTSPVRSREERLYTPALPDELVCKAESSENRTTAPESGDACGDPTTDLAAASSDLSASSLPVDASSPDYITLSVGAGAFVGGDLALTLDRFGHLYLGVGAGVGVSPTVVSASLHGGRLTERPPPDRAEECIGGFLEGNAVEVTGSLGTEVGIASSPGGTAVEAGIGLAQISAQFQRNWPVLHLPVRW